jgi:hypothetical protein
LDKRVFDEKAGYWTYELQEYGVNVFDPKTTRICIATGMEKDRLPEPLRGYGMQIVGGIHCIVEGRFWIWQETLPWVETDGGILFHPKVRL